MELTGKRIQGVAVLDVQGRLIGEPGNCDKFHEVFKSLLDEGEKNFVVDLTSSDWADSRGIGMLIGAYTSARRAGGDLVLTGVSARTASILKVTQLSLIFKEFTGVAEAATYLLAPKPAITRTEPAPAPNNDFRTV